MESNKRPREGDGAQQLFMGYTAEKYFDKMFDRAGLVRENDGLKTKLTAAETKIAELERRIAELERGAAGPL
jgi:hypothetical protein